MAARHAARGEITRLSGLLSGGVAADWRSAESDKRQAAEALEQASRRAANLKEYRDELYKRIEEATRFLFTTAADKSLNQAFQEIVGKPGEEDAIEAAFIAVLNSDFE